MAMGSPFKTSGNFFGRRSRGHAMLVDDRSALSRLGSAAVLRGAPVERQLTPAVAGRVDKQTSTWSGEGLLRSVSGRPPQGRFGEPEPQELWCRSAVVRVGRQSTQRRRPEPRKAVCLYRLRWSACLPALQLAGCRSRIRHGGHLVSEGAGAGVERSFLQHHRQR